MSKQVKQLYEFRSFRIDPSQRVLSGKGKPVAVHLKRRFVPALPGLSFKRVRKVNVLSQGQGIEGMNYFRLVRS